MKNILALVYEKTHIHQKKLFVHRLEGGGCSVGHAEPRGVGLAEGKKQGKKENAIPQHGVAQGLKGSRRRRIWLLDWENLWVPFCLESFKRKELNSNHEQTDSKGPSLPPSLCKAGCGDSDDALPSLLSCSQLQEPVHNAFLAQPASRLLSSSTELRNTLPMFPPSPCADMNC